jgi:type III pantothenate kinase
MILAVDVGNTQTHMGVFEGAELRQQWRLPTDPAATPDQIASEIAGLFTMTDISPQGLEGGIVSTVVPRLGPVYEDLSERYLGQRALVVGPDLKTGMPILLDNPRELGSDRLVNAVSAYDKVGGAAITVDFGTSTNFDAVSADGEYLGGAIGPGVEVSLEALASRAARLSSVDVSKPGDAIGKHTVAAVQSGFAYGFAGLVDGIVRRMAEELVTPARCIATGGIAETIAPHCETIDETDPLLTLTGLRLIYERNA